LVAGAMFTGSLAIAAQGNDQVRSKARVRAASKPIASTTMRTGGGAAIRNNAVRVRGNTVVRNGTVRNRSNVFVNRGNTVVRSGTVRSGNNVFVTRRSGYSYYPSYSYGYGYPYSYGYGYPYYSYGPSVSFGFGYPYYGYGYGYPYDYSYYGGYPSNYSYGYYGYTQPGYGTYNGSVVVAVQTQLARAGYYHGVIDGVMGPRTSYAIQAYERDHGLRVDGAISGQLMRNMGIRY
jgi:Putative peptidoglycan binding domain